MVVIDHVSDARLSGIEVNAYEKLADGSEVWKAKRSTDAQGLATFDLDGLGDGRKFVMKAKPYGAVVSSQELSQPNWYQFRVGKLQVQVLDGATGQPKTGQSVGLMRWPDGGSAMWVMGGTTDAQGWVRLDPEGIGTEPLVLTATSPSDGQQKVSEKLMTKGPHRFYLGNAPVVARMQDAVSGSALGGQWVEAWEVLPSGASVFRLKRWTDGTGIARFDLDGVAEGRRYVLKAQPYLQAVELDVGGGAGEKALRVGRLQAQVIDGRNGTPYAGRDVSLQEVLSDGSYRFVATFKTDVEGKLKLDPQELGARRYALRAASLVDGSQRTSATYASTGSVQFKVGTAGLNIVVIDHVSDARLSGIEVNAYEKLADGSEVWKAKRSTDAQGLATFDLDGLGDGRKFVMKAKPYGAVVSSQELSQPNWYQFRVGKLQVQVLDGATGQPKTGQSVGLMRWPDGGSATWVMGGTTDAQGWVRLDPDGIGTEPLVLTATSPSDGQQKVSEKLMTKGPHRFYLGNAPVVARMQDAVSGSALGGQWVEAWEVLPSGASVFRLKRWTDGTGTARFDLDGVVEGRRYVLKAQPYLQAVELEVGGSAGEKALRVGRLQAQVIDGRNGTPYAGRDVSLHEVLSDGSYRFVATFKTDAEGKLKLDPQELGARRYALRAASLVDGSQRTSAAYASTGSVQFKVGTAGLNIVVIDHVSDARLSGIEVNAYEKLADGSEVWKAKRSTDAQGLATFDLDGLGAGRRYFVRAVPHGTIVDSDVLSNPLWYQFRVGTSPAALSELSSGRRLAGVTIQAFEKTPNGTLVPVIQAVTDGGGIARFDLAGVGSGREYVLKALNPFGDTNDHFSDVIASRGLVAFAVQKDEVNEPDRLPPTISIETPGALSRISFAGVRLTGTADDDEAIREVRLIVILPSGKVIEKAATWRASSKNWFVHSGVLDDALSGRVRAIMRAIDHDFNEAETSLDLDLVVDRTAPTIEVTSHTSGSIVPARGFILSGQVIDDTIGSSLQIAVSGGGLANSQTQEVEVAQESGRWTAIIAPDDSFTGSLSLALQATDGAGNSTSRTITLQTSDVFSQAWHVLQRTSFGPTPEAYAAATAIGPNATLQAQMMGDGVNDAGYAEQASSLSAGTHIATDFVRHAAYADQQLREVMTWFWDNHFNTHFFAHENSAFEQQENQAFRLHALGNFRNLLGISAKSPAMLYTLDGRLNVMGRPNENYARELLELHTMGVNGGYTQRDVEEVARAFTGWTVKDGVFAFIPASHDNGAKTILNRTLPAGQGMLDGEMVLDIAAAHSATANFICRKLVTLFVSDRPVDSLLTRCAQTFVAQHAAPDQIAQVLQVILTSSEFLGSSYRNAKLKSPLEYVISAVRQLGGEQAGDDISNEIQRQGMPLFLYSVPTGFHETGDKWLSSGMLHLRSRFVDRLLMYTDIYAEGATQTRFALAAKMADEGYQTSEAVAGRMLERLFGPTYVRRHRQLALDLLTENGAYPYIPNAPDAESRLRRLGKALATLPDFHLQ